MRDKEFFLEIIRKWKFSWMNQRQNDDADYKNYHHRAYGIDSNMVHSLAEKLAKEINPDTARLEWMIKNHAKVSETNSGKWVCEIIRLNGYRSFGEYDTSREAIDAATKEYGK